MRLSMLLLLLLLLVLVPACAGHLDPDDYRLPGPDPESPDEGPTREVRTSVHPETGQVVARWTVRTTADGRSLKDGREQRFHPDGARRALRHFRRGRPTGEWRSWYPDGTLRSEYAFDDRPTPMRFYHPSGAPSAAGPAVDGVREGRWTFWYPDGRVRKEGAYRDGERHGLWTLYHPGGGLRSRGVYREDRRVGEWRHWKALPPTRESEWRPEEPGGPAASGRR